MQLIEEMRPGGISEAPGVNGAQLLNSVVFQGLLKSKTSKFPCFVVIRYFFKLNVLLLELICLDKLKLEYTLCLELSSTALGSLGAHHFISSESSSSMRLPLCFPLL